MKFKAGDTYAVTNIPCIFPGIIISGQKTLLFSIPVPWSMEDVSTIAITTLNGSLRAVSGYIGNHDVDLTAETGYTWSVVRAGRYMLRLQLTLTTAASETANTPVMLCTNSFKFTFS